MLCVLGDCCGGATMKYSPPLRRRIPRACVVLRKRKQGSKGRRSRMCAQRAARAHTHRRQSGRLTERRGGAKCREVLRVGARRRQGRRELEMQEPRRKDTKCSHEGTGEVGACVGGCRGAGGGRGEAEGEAGGGIFGMTPVPGRCGCEREEAAGEGVVAVTATALQAGDDCACQLVNRAAPLARFHGSGRRAQLWERTIKWDR